MTDNNIPDGSVDPTTEARPLPGPMPRPVPLPGPFPLPIYIGVSGLYRWRSPALWPRPLPVPLDPIPVPRPIPVDPPGPPQPGPRAEAGFTPVKWWLRSTEDLRLDVDGRYPQMAASGTLRRPLRPQIHWIAALAVTGADSWSGTVWSVEGDAAAFPYSQVDITAQRGIFPASRSVTVRFSGGGRALTRTYQWASRAFREVELEFDTVTGASPVTTIATHDHPNRPASLPSESLSVAEVFERAGFDVRSSGGDGAIPVHGAGADLRWSNAEMHDAMQLYWSRFADRPQWSLWVLAAKLHEQGASLGGIMFDDIGPNHRQGTAMFTDSFISQAPAGESAPGAWVERMKFWTTVHEMGHAFNLAHSWQKSLGTAWMPLADEPEARSFMNYPYRVAGGEKAFFADFEYRFSDAELLFMRHGPERFVRMGDADWFDDHALRRAPGAPRLAVRLRAERADGTYEFMEPVRVAASLANVSDGPALIDPHALEEAVLVVRRDGEAAQTVQPFARMFHRAPVEVLGAGMVGSEHVRLVSAGTTGWQIAEPGRYTVRLAAVLDGELLLSNAVRLRVLPATCYAEQVLAQDYFTDEVARVLRFGGSRCLSEANATLEAVREKLAGRRVAVHAGVALGLPLLRPFRTLAVGARAAGPGELLGPGPVFASAPAEPERARALLRPLTEDAPAAAETLGREIYAEVTGQAARALRAADDHAAADALDAAASLVAGPSQ